MMLNELRQFMAKYFSFGDFVFRTPEGVEVGRATDLAVSRSSFDRPRGEHPVPRGAEPFLQLA